MEVSPTLVKALSKEEYVNWSVFIWVVSIFSLIVIGLATVVISELKEISEIRSNLAGMRSDISYIKSGLDEVRHYMLKEGGLTYNK